MSVDYVYIYINICIMHICYIHIYSIYICKYMHMYIDILFHRVTRGYLFRAGRFRPWMEDIGAHACGPTSIGLP